MPLSQKLTLRLFITISFSIFLNFNFVFADYKISGTVVDKSNDAPLQGANVIIEGTKKGTITDKKGKFKISDIEKKRIKIVVKYIGYLPDSIEHDFKEEKKAEFHFKLELDPIYMKEVVVQGEAVGQVKAFLEQSRAENIKNVVSAEQISQFPDLNAAEAMQRIPGITLQRDQGEGKYVQLRGTPPELTNFNINGEQIPSPEGNVRYVGMDIISADQIAFIEISKVLTPDMDGDGIGGTVDIKTKKATSSTPEINTTFAGGFNNLRSTDNYQIQMSYGLRQDKIGFSMNASYYINNQGSDNMEFKYAKGPFWGSTNEGKDNYHVQYREAQLRHYTITRERIGLSATIDYQLDEKNSFYLRGMLNQFNDDETRRRKTYDVSDALSDKYYINCGIKHDVRDRLQEQSINTLNFGGSHNFEFIETDYEISYANAKEEQPNSFETAFETTGQYFAIKFDRTNKDMPKATYPDTANGSNATAYEKYQMDKLLFEDVHINDENITGKINLKIPYKISINNDGYFKVGVKARFKDKTRNINAQEFASYQPSSRVYPGVGPDLYLTTIKDDFVDKDFLDKGYMIDNIPDPDKMRYFYEYNSQYFIFDRTATKMKSFGEDYRAEENIYAAFAMVKHDLGKLMMLGGVRFEKTDIDYQGIKIVTSRGIFQSMDTLEDRRSHEFILPQFQIKYSFSESFNLRSAITYTYARPSFEDVLPYREQDRNEVKYGNPELEFPTSMNIDLLAEKYFNKGGLISSGIFYKNIENFIFYYKRFAHEGEDFSNYGLVEIEKAVNGIEAFVYGAEIQVQHKFDFLPWFFSDFGIYSNYTYTYSEAFINKRLPANYAEAVVIFGQDDLSLYTDNGEREKISLPGQAMHTVNLALFYDIDWLYLKISANYHDTFLYELGADKDLDMYYNEALHLDFTASYSITDNIKFFVDMINLTNAPLKFYLGSPEYIAQQEYYSWWGRMGFKMKI